jgi:hypothetical protein
MDLQTRYGRDKLSAPFVGIGKLRYHFVQQVPGQDHDIVGPEIFKLDFVHNRNAAARHVFALFGRVAVHHKRDEVLADAGIVQQGIAAP